MKRQSVREPYRVRRLQQNSINIEQSIDSSQCLANNNEDGSLHHRDEALQIDVEIQHSEPIRKKRRRRSRARQINDLAAADGQPIPTGPSLLQPPTFCTECGAKKFESESPSFCCANGEVRVASNAPPPDLVRLFKSTDEDAVHFRTYCRLYNNLFAFSSLGGHIDCKTHKGIYVFQLHGQLYHFLPNLIPDNCKPKFLQLYFYDSQHEQHNRASLYEQLRPDVIHTLMTILENNPYAKFFKSLREVTIDEQTTIRINKNPSLDQRVYNAPTSDEVAAILSERDVDDTSNGPYIIVFGKSDKAHRIQHYFGCYDPLQYPLLFPFGDNGWHPGIPKVGRRHSVTAAAVPTPIQSANTAEEVILGEETAATHHRSRKQKDISCREYYCYMFQIRVRTFVLVGGRLLLQFIVDIYVKIENTRLDFFRNNQPTIRADLYQGILDTVIIGEVDGRNVGHRIILPPSFIGGPRDMRRRYLNAMALVQKYGKPDIFATMTCNPNWAEIKNELGEGEKAQDRPDLIARIFHAKLKAAKQEIMDEQIFGPVAAFIYVVEFQKRGLPHAHFLIILKPGYKIKTPTDFDKFVRAEIPSSSTPHLRATVLNHMMHGPCGTVNPNCPCMKERQGKRVCKAKYPKQFSAHTTNNDDGYPIYKRRDTGEVVTIRGKEMDNRWVIPYNPYLLAMFDCHFNVEICSTIQAVKYLYKYVYKGHDRVSFSVGQSSNQQPVNEIDNFQSGRWISPPEAAWRIFSFDLYEMYPAVLPLQVHCENLHSVHFRSDESLSSILSDPRRSRTPLTEFFRMNRECPSGDKLLYSEFPQHFVWNDTSRNWSVRKKGAMIGRLTFVGPSEADRFFLRILLANVRGPTSFLDLKIVDGYECATYQEACLRRGLVEQSDAAEKCLDEATTIQMPQALRRLFATVLIFCRPPNPKYLWDKYYNFLSEDFRYMYPHSEEQILANTAEKVEHLLEGMGKDLAEFGLDHLKQVQHEGMRITRDVRDALEAPLPEEYIAARKKLNTKQREAYKDIISHVKQGIPAAFFIDGPGGTGKTFLYGALYGKVRQMNKIVLPTASSGIAAAGLPSGRTAHSRFKLPIDYKTTLTCDVPKQGSLAALIKETTMIIWDEAPMANKANVHALDLLLKDLCDPDLLFGGKIVVFGGDFRQVLPVVPQKTQNEALEASLVSSPFWPHFIRHHLHDNMRAREDPDFANFLLALGDGKLQHSENALVKLPSQISTSLIESADPVEELLKVYLPENASLPSVPELFNDRAILAPKNDEADSLNRAFIERFEGENVMYKSFDSLLDDTCSIYPTEFLNTLCPGGMSPHELVLKKGCPVILLRNIDPSSGLCNGTRLTCKAFLPNILLCEISSGFYKGQETMLPRVCLRPSSSSNFPFQFQRKQFPVKLSFAMTINKSQGQTLNEVGLYLHSPCFSHGQLYVALSRARKAGKVKVISSRTTESPSEKDVKNIVSFEVLERAGIR